MIQIPQTSINFVVLWVAKREDGKYADRDGFVFDVRPAVDEVFEIGGHKYAFSYWEHQDRQKNGKLPPKSEGYEPQNYEFWYFNDQR